MALSFPNSPTEGQIYTDTPSGNRWVWDSANTIWKSTSTFTQTITVSSTAPGTPVVGQLWWNQDYGRLLVYYSDGTSSQWVDASPSDYTSQLAYASANSNWTVTNTVYTVANAAFGKANNALANTSGVSTAGDLTVAGRLGVGANNGTTDGVYTLGNFWAQHGGSDRYLHLGSSSNYYWRIKAQYDDLLIHDASNTAAVMIKYSTGNVGIGNTSPVSKLHVQGRISTEEFAYKQLRFNGSGSDLSPTGASESAYRMFNGMNMKNLGMFEFRGGSQYLHLKTNWQNDGMMYQFLVMGYLYNNANCWSLMGGYTYNAGIIQSYISTPGQYGFNGAYRTSEGNVCVRLARGDSNYSEGYVTVYVHTHTASDQNALAVVAYAQNNTAGAHF